MLQFPDINPYVPLLGPYRFHLMSWDIGPIGVRWYALAYIAGIVLGWRYGIRLVKNQRLWGPASPTATPVQIDDLILWLTIGVVVGGRLGSMIFYDTKDLFSHPLVALQIWNGGMSFHGGMIGVAIAILLFARSNKIDILKLADLVAPCVPFGLFFGRIANFINGELWGRPTHAPWGMVFCNETLRKAFGSCEAGYEPRHPSQLYEATLEGIVLFLILRWATHRMKWLQRQGALTGLFLASYACVRILLENVREPDRWMPKFPLGLTMGMMLSIPMFLVGAWMIWRALKLPAEAVSPA